jgi:hypothetical protein
MVEIINSNLAGPANSLNIHLKPRIPLCYEGASPKTLN